MNNLNLLVRKAAETVTTSPVDATGPWSGASKNYRFISTSKIIELAERAGFEVHKTTVSRTRRADKIGFQKHRVDLIHKDFKAPAVLGDSVPRLTIINGMDSSTSFKMLAGFFRLICENGLVAPEAFGFQSLKVYHTGARDLESTILQSLENYLTQMPKLIEFQKRLRERQLETMEQIMLARALADYIEQSTGKQNVYSMDLLNARRPADIGNDAWTVLNRLQENAIRGGYKFHSSTTGAVRTAAAIKAIDTDIKLNQFILQAVGQLLTA